jgi:glycine hydroxymethyltransferase
VGGVHESPVDYVDVIMTTTHKSLRGPRGAVIGITKKGLARDPDLAKKIDKAVFPGLQGGPHENTIASMAVAFAEADTLEFKEYALQIVKNAKALAESLRENGLKVFGTENHLMVVEVGLEKGKLAAVELEKNGIIVNANTVPHEKGSPMNPSGIRIGTPAMTTRGWKEKEFEELGVKMAGIILSI